MQDKGTWKDWLSSCAAPEKVVYLYVQLVKCMVSIGIKGADDSAEDVSLQSHLHSIMFGQQEKVITMYLHVQLKASLNFYHSIILRWCKKRTATACMCAKTKLEIEGKQ